MPPPEAGPSPAEVNFLSGGERLAAWHFAGEGEAPRPCVVMAHGFGGTRDSGLRPFAERFAAAGLDAVVFDYRTFGASTGEPRQLIDWRRHREDYHAAIAFARGLPGVDADRIVLWGSAYSGGHVIAVAADDGRVAAVISQVPATDGLAALVEMGRYAGIGQLLRLTRSECATPSAAHSAASRCGCRRRPARLAHRDDDRRRLAPLLAIAGPTFRNEFCARGALDAGRNRPLTRAADLPCPTLFQIADRDSVAPSSAVYKTAWNATGRAEVRTYPFGHFDIYVAEGFERAVGDQLHFLRRHVAAGEREGVAAATGSSA